MLQELGRTVLSKHNQTRIHGWLTVNLIALVEDIEKNCLFDGHLASQNIKKMNDILYEILEPDLLRNDGRVFSFIDVCLKRHCHTLLGVQMGFIWNQYGTKTLWPMFWETFCNSVLLHAFWCHTVSYICEFLTYSEILTRLWFLLIFYIFNTELFFPIHR